MKDKSFTKTYLEVVRIIGMVSIIVYLINVPLDFLTDYMVGFTISFGITAMIVSSAMLLHKTFMKESKIAEKDERLLMIRGKVMSTTFVIQYWTVVVLIIVFGLFSETYFISLTLAGLFFIEYILMLCLDLYYKKKY